MPDDVDFLTRWSRRKAAARRAEATEAAELAPVAEPDQPAESRPVEVPDLPDPATLEIGSDFKAFMGENVPGNLRREALRRLWRVNPIINSPDGLDDYYVTKDFTDAATVLPDLRTLYRVGKGMLDTAGQLEEAANEVSGQTEPARVRIGSDYSLPGEADIADDAPMPVTQAPPGTST